MNSGLFNPTNTDAFIATTRILPAGNAWNKNIPVATAHWRMNVDLSQTGGGLRRLWWSSVGVACERVQRRSKHLGFDVTMLISAGTAFFRRPFERGFTGWHLMSHENKCISHRGGVYLVGADGNYGNEGVG